MPETIHSYGAAMSATDSGVGTTHQLAATPDTCFWGYFDHDQPPVLEVAPGDVVEIETLTHHAGDAPDLMMDDRVRALWDSITERGPGVHIMTGPLHVAGARAGDTVSVTIESMQPRFRYGSTVAAHWGGRYEAFNSEWVTIWELPEGDGAATERLARPAYWYDFTGRPLYDQPGFLSDPPAAERRPFSRPVSVPAHPHFGVLGVAPASPGRVSSIPPDVYGGNIDNWRLGPGATLHLPVFVEGANLFAGDPHLSQGDGEVCGTAIECSLDARIRVTLTPELSIDAPVLETATHWYTHGFSEDLDVAMRNCVDRMIDLVVAQYGLNRKEAYTLLSVAGHVGVTQVVDGNLGCHTGVAKALFV